MNAALACPYPHRHGVARIAAWSSALSLHLLALGLLLLPISPTTIPARIEQALEAQWVEILPPTPVEPLPPVPQPPVVPVRREARVATPAPDLAPATPVADAGPQRVPAPVEALAPSAPEAAGATGGTDDGQLAYLHAPPPPYPRDALRKHQQGTVLLEVLVDAQGRPRTVTLLRSSGYPSLDAEARRHVLRRWRFRPALQDGVAIPARGRVPLRFAIAAG
jgi:periplasmic protein TonB